DKIDMDSEGKQDRDELSIFSRCVFEQVENASIISPTLGSDNLEFGTKTLTRVVREVLEKVFEASLERNKKLVQGRYTDCRKKSDCSSLRLGHCSMKRVRMHLSGNSGFVEGACSGAIYKLLYI
ncbi:hypothetical protein J1N35_018675, partial [Gossypium stocksii]